MAAFALVVDAKDDQSADFYRHPGGGAALLFAQGAGVGLISKNENTGLKHYKIGGKLVTVEIL